MTIQEIIHSIDFNIQNGNDTIPTTQEDLMTIKNALEKDIPKKLLMSGEYNYLCPHCKSCLKINVYDVTALGLKIKRCENCGQLFDWNLK